MQTIEDDINDDYTEGENSQGSNEQQPCDLCQCKPEFFSPGHSGKFLKSKPTKPRLSKIKFSSIEKKPGHLIEAGSKWFSNDKNQNRMNTVKEISQTDLEIPFTKSVSRNMQTQTDLEFFTINPVLCFDSYADGLQNSEPEKFLDFNIGSAEIELLQKKLNQKDTPKLEPRTDIDKSEISGILNVNLEESSPEHMSIKLVDNLLGIIHDRDPRKSGNG